MSRAKRRAVLAVGIGFGDEGKGSIVDFVARESESSLVCRFNGGSQAAHNVVHERYHHTFSQFGSGTFSGARTFLSAFMLVSPTALLKEAQHLREIGISDPLDLVYVDEAAFVTTPFHVAANRIREEHRGAGRHGSCGMGIGETVVDALAGEALRVGDLLSPRVRGALSLVRQRKIDQLTAEGIEPTNSADWDMLLKDFSVDYTAERYASFVNSVHVVDSDWLRGAMREGATIFEGAQGVLIDQDYGFHPHTTWSNTRFDNANTLLSWASFDGDVTRMGITRSYLTRHGPGPFPTVNPELKRGDDHNPFNQWQREFREGAPDYVLTQYALDVLGGVDEIVMTHLDAPSLAPCVAYELPHLPGRVTDLPVLKRPTIERQERLGASLMEAKPIYGDVPRCPADAFAERFGVPVTIASHGPTSADKRRRNT